MPTFQIDLETIPLGIFLTDHCCGKAHLTVDGVTTGVEILNALNKAQSSKPRSDFPLWFLLPCLPFRFLSECKFLLRLLSLMDDKLGTGKNSFSPLLVDSHSTYHSNGKQTKAWILICCHIYLSFECVQFN